MIVSDGRLPPRLPDPRPRRAGRSPVGRGGEGRAPLAYSPITDYHARAPRRRPARGPRGRARRRPAGAADRRRRTSSSRRGAATATGTTRRVWRGCCRRRSAARSWSTRSGCGTGASPDDAPWDRAPCGRAGGSVGCGRKSGGVAAHMTQVAAAVGRSRDARDSCTRRSLRSSTGTSRSSSGSPPPTLRDVLSTPPRRAARRPLEGTTTAGTRSSKRPVSRRCSRTQRSRDVLEVGCGIGVLTADLASRARPTLLAAVGRVRGRSAVERRPGAAGRAARSACQGRRRGSWVRSPSGSFDLVVLSEVGYYLSRPSSTACMAAPSRPAGRPLVACHWRHPVAAARSTATTCTAASGSLGPRGTATTNGRPARGLAGDRRDPRPHRAERRGVPRPRRGGPARRCLTSIGAAITADAQAAREPDGRPGARARPVHRRSAAVIAGIGDPLRAGARGQRGRSRTPRG